MMKKSLFRTGKLILLAAELLAVMTACRKENSPSGLHAVMNDYANSGQKAYIDSEKYSCFVVGEKIRVNSSTGTVTALERDGRQCVIGDVDEATDYKAFYPAGLLADETVDLSSGLDSVAVSFPRVQEYKKGNGNQIIDNPMIAQLSGFNDDNNTLHFQNLCALLKITVCTSKAFDSIRVTMPGTSLWGNGHVSINDNKVLMDEMNDVDPDYRETVVLKLPEGHYGSPNGEDFLIMIPEVTVQNCTVKVEVLNRSALVKSFSLLRTDQVALNHNMIHRLAVFSFDASMFSVSATKKVVFSPGNLQFQAVGCTQVNNQNNGDLVGGTWRFAEHQWDTIGNNPGNSEEDANKRRTQSAWIDLFCWATSGWHSNGATYWTPFRLGASNTGYNPGGSLSNSLTGQYARADWGVFNNIYNPSTQFTDPAGTWYTMTKDEWVYLLDSRSGIRFALAQLYNVIGVDSVNGMLIFPDNWDPTWYQPSNYNNYTAKFFSNQISFSYFQQQLESRGVAFLPAAGNQAGGQNPPVAEVGVSGSYWSSTCKDGEGKAYGLYFTNRTSNLGDVGSSGTHSRGRARSVRLVRPVQ